MSYVVPEVFVSSQCAFYEGYYMAIQNMGVFIVKLGLIFFVFDFFVSLINRFIDKWLEGRNK